MKIILHGDICNDSLWEMQLRNIIDGIALNLKKLKLSMGYSRKVGSLRIWQRGQIAEATIIHKAHFPGKYYPVE